MEFLFGFLSGGVVVGTGAFFFGKYRGKIAAFAEKQVDKFISPIVK